MSGETGFSLFGINTITGATSVSYTTVALASNTNILGTQGWISTLFRILQAE